MIDKKALNSADDQDFVRIGEGPDNLYPEFDWSIDFPLFPRNSLNCVANISK